MDVQNGVMERGSRPEPAVAIMNNMRCVENMLSYGKAKYIVGAKKTLSGSLFGIHQCCKRGLKSAGDDTVEQYVQQHLVHCLFPLHREW